MSNNPGNSSVNNAVLTSSTVPDRQRWVAAPRLIEFQTDDVIAELVGLRQAGSALALPVTLLSHRERAASVHECVV
jgi:hypothetical protein